MDDRTPTESQYIVTLRRMLTRIIRLHVMARYGAILMGIGNLALQVHQIAVASASILHDVPEILVGSIFIPASVWVGSRWGEDIARRALSSLEMPARETAERERAEAALKRLTDFNTTVFNSMVAGIAVIDVGDFSLATVNRAFCEQLGISKRDVLGKSYYETTHNGFEPCTSGGQRCPLVETVRNGRAGLFEHEHYRSDGSRIHVEISSSPVRDENGEVIQVVHVAQDTGERRFLQEQLIEAQKMEAVGHLAGGIAHEFNNLRTPMMRFTQLGMNRLDDDHPVRNYLQEILRAGERSATLTRQLLTFSRRQIVQSQIVSLNDMVSGISNMIQSLIGEGIELEHKLEPELGMVNVDPGQMEQVLVNLAVNARDAMLQGGNLTIGTANVVLTTSSIPLRSELAPGDYVKLWVTDTGTGMDDEVKSHLFEPFFTTKEQGQGTGLGLATYYGIVKQGGGDIRAVSDLGGGSTFEVYLPRVVGVVPDEAENDGLVELPTGGETVLLVEDEPLVQRLAAQVLRQQGYEVLEAANGEEALLVSDEHCDQKIHLLLTDVVMPQMGGKELADRLQSQRPGIGMLFTSGYPDDTIARYGILNTGISFLSKPFTPEMIAHKVREVLNTSQQLHT